MNTAAKRRLLHRVLGATARLRQTIVDTDLELRELHDPDLDEHLVICELARRHLAQRATELLDDLDEPVLEEAVNG